MEFDLPPVYESEQEALSTDAEEAEEDVVVVQEDESPSDAESEDSDTDQFLIMDSDFGSPFDSSYDGIVFSSSNKRPGSSRTKSSKKRKVIPRRTRTFSEFSYDSLDFGEGDSDIGDIASLQLGGGFDLDLDGHGMDTICVELA